MMAYPEFYNDLHTTVHLKFYKVRELLVVVNRKRPTLPILSN